MTEHYSQFGEAAGAAMAYNARMAADAAEVRQVREQPATLHAQAAQPDPQPWRCTSTRDGQRCHYPAGHHGADAANNWNLHQDTDGNEWSDR